jgi:hypothetical protein
MTDDLNSNYWWTFTNITGTGNETTVVIPPLTANAFYRLKVD